MPLPDASKKSPRVYTLLQNTDLDNVTFDTVQAVGNPIAIEEANEDEMRRLVLVNLCRLVTSGEWNGLLSAGSAIQYAFDPIDASLMEATYTRFSPTDVYRLKSTTTTNTNVEDRALFIRFVAPKDGTMGQITIRTGQTNTGADDVSIGIYESSSGIPSTAIGLIDIDVNGSADLYTSSSWTTTPTLTAGDTYWIGFCPAGSTIPNVTMAASAQYLCLGFTHYPGTPYTTLYNASGTDYDMPATVTVADLDPYHSFALPVWSYKYA